jgi:cellulose synthase (UDP-forming)
MRIASSIVGVGFVALMVTILIYAIVRITFTALLAPEYTHVEHAFSFMLLAGELFLLVHALGYAIALLRANKRLREQKEEYFPMPAPPPEVAVLVAARHEPREVLENTFRSIVHLRYPNKRVYFLDDSSDEIYMREAEEIAAKFGLVLFRRKVRHGAKAGIVNDCLKGLKEKYVAIFDADQRPIQGFLTNIIPILDADEKLAFAQTPQYYSNLDESRVAKGAAYQQAIFYEYICEAKSSDQSMFCCGTNVVFRREALLSVGGFDETVVTEDFATSIDLHMNGWKSYYYDHVSTFGMGPEMLAAYFKQQDRWARGTVGVLRKVIWNFLKHPLGLKPAQWWEYFLSSTYYFVGLVFLILMICPITYVFFSVPSFFIHTDIYFSVFLPYFSLSLAIFFLTMRARHYKLKNLFIGQMLINITFPILIVATLLGLLGIQGSFGITLKGKGKRMSYLSLWPQLAFFYLNFAAFVWGLNRFYYERDFSLIVNCFWVLYHFLIMMSVFYFNEDLPEPALEEAPA